MGPTDAQRRYEGLADLGNTQPGDGRKFAGHTAMQITGRANTKAFRDWCRKHIDASAPDFLRFPDLINTDPWEDLGPLWYWDTRNLNRFADQGDVENITVKINGGLNGYADRLALLARASLVLLGYNANDIRRFQEDAGLVVDGSAGPKTRAALHARLLAFTAKGDQPADAASAPVVEEKPVAVTPPALDKPVDKTGGFWERIGQIALAGGSRFAALLGDWRVVVAIAGASIVLGGLDILFHARIIAAVRDLKREITA
ncbi:putative chitinase [Bosea robiniae]|uniref:Chitinase n=1 Tax=Bosea robiniae TaxID=1036780 RepID=A0ABY0NF67_9HYPH|nr:putative chitinase [Bosea robiniae]